MKESCYIKSPIGNLKLSANEKGLTSIEFVSNYQDETKKIGPLLQQASKELTEYFAGKRKSFSVPLAPKGTDFQLKVWKNLTKIPYGGVKSYKEVAIMSNSPKAQRAVGLANNKNPLPIIIPCHRVIGSNGKLVGYGGGLPIKKQLLELEGYQYES